MQIIALNAVGTTTTSNPIELTNLRNITIQIIASGISSGNGKFEIEGSNNGDDWDALPCVRSLANTNSQDLTRDISVTLSSNTNEVLALENFYLPKMIRVKLTFTTDGSYSAIISGQKITT